MILMHFQKYLNTEIKSVLEIFSTILISEFEKYGQSSIQHQVFISESFITSKGFCIGTEDQLQWNKCLAQHLSVLLPKIIIWMIQWV